MTTDSTWGWATISRLLMLFTNVQCPWGAATRPSLFPAVAKRHIALVLCLGWLVSGAAFAKGVYQDPADFVSESLAGKAPAPQALWISADLLRVVEPILGHPYGALRVRYWERDGRTVWVLEETGKEQPITAGLVVDHDHIVVMKVLIFRETRGDEVRHPCFTDQFTGAGLTVQNQLDRPIDGVSCATLSTRALIKLARLALLLHQHRNDSAHGAPLTAASRPAAALAVPVAPLLRSGGGGLRADTRGHRVRAQSRRTPAARPTPRTGDLAVELVRHLRRRDQRRFCRQQPLGPAGRGPHILGRPRARLGGAAAGCSSAGRRRGDRHPDRTAVAHSARRHRGETRQA